MTDEEMKRGEEKYQGKLKRSDDRVQKLKQRTDWSNWRLSLRLRHVQSMPAPKSEKKMHQSIGKALEPSRSGLMQPQTQYVACRETTKIYNYITYNILTVFALGFNYIFSVTYN